MVLEIDAFLFPLGEDPFDLLLDTALFVFDLLADLLELLHRLLVCSFQMPLLSVVVTAQLRESLLVVLSRFSELLAHVVHFVLRLSPHSCQLGLALDHGLPLLGELLVQRLVLLVETRVHFTLALDYGLQLGDVVVEQLVRLVRGEELLLTHFDFHFLVVRNFHHFLLQTFYFRRHVAICGLDLLLEGLDLLVFHVSHVGQLLLVTHLKPLHELVFLLQLPFEVLDLLRVAICVLGARHFNPRIYFVQGSLALSLDVFDLRLQRAASILLSSELVPDSLERRVSGSQLSVLPLDD